MTTIIKKNSVLILRKGLSIYNPCCIIELDGTPIIQIFEDCFLSPAKCESFAKIIYRKLKKELS